MNDYKNFCEYAVRPEPDGKMQLLRVLLIAAYTLFTLVYITLFWVIAGAWVMLILLPFLMYAIFTLTWRFTRVEYEYSIEAGVLRVAKIYDGRSRRTKLTLELSDLTSAAPCTEPSPAALNARDITRTDDYRTSPQSEEGWLCVFADRKTGRKRALLLDCNAEMIRIMRLCNPSAVARASL
ncbi:MAG: hypothetical protein IJ493_07770 [Clostridia bacterium]|nr:hypothetical protein [Clostridia bacterium]